MTNSCRMDIDSLLLKRLNGELGYKELVDALCALCENSPCITICAPPIGTNPPS